MNIEQGRLRQIVAKLFEIISYIYIRKAKKKFKVNKKKIEYFSSKFRTNI